MSLFSPSTQQALDSNGDPISGAKWKFYEAGTSTPTNAYADADLSTGAASVFTADGFGRFSPIFLDDSVAYRAVLTNASNVTIDPYDIDNVTGTASSNVAVTRGGSTGDVLGLRRNIAVGTSALQDNTFVDDGYAAGGGIFYDQGSWNYAFGDYALENNTTGHRNHAFGHEAGQAVTEGSYNIFLGARSGVHLTTGWRNIFVGVQAGQEGTTGDDNTGVGTGALLLMTDGEENCAFGRLAMGGAAVTGDQNCAFGMQAGLQITSGNLNCVFGHQAGSGITTGSRNVAIGPGAFGTNQTGVDNVAIGYRALSPSTVSNNTAVGTDAGVSATTGTKLCFLGYNAGATTTTGQNVICIGSGALASSATASDETTIGDANMGTLRLGAAGVFKVSATDMQLSKTATAAATTGAQTIHKPAGSVNFAAAATTLVVTNSLVTANSIIIATVNTNDATMKTVLAVAAAGSFTLHANAAATAETRVSFLVIN